jgi:hypothetical protein
VVLYGSLATPALGILSVWLYAAIRPRYGAGPTTSVIAGFAVWLVTFLVDACWATLGIVSVRLFVIMKVTDLLAIVLATIPLSKLNWLNDVGVRAHNTAFRASRFQKI